MKYRLINGRIVNGVGKPIQLNLTAMLPFDPRQPAMIAQIRRLVVRCLRDFPDICEGSIKLAGKDCWFSYVVRDPDTIDMNLVLRDYAESILNEHGLSTHEPFNPLPESWHKQ
jgi:hypothetical protein